MDGKIKKALSLFKACIQKAVWLGVEPHHDTSVKRVIIYSNVMVYLGLVLGFALSNQLVKLGLDPFYRYWYWGLMSISFGVPLFHYLRKILVAHIFGLCMIVGYAAQAVVVFGKSFNGYHFIYLGLIYSVIAFSKYSLKVRIPVAFFTFLVLPILDYLSHKQVLPVTGLHSSDFHFSLIINDTLMITGLIIVVLWIEKSLADKHEKLLEKAFHTIKNQKSQIDSIFENVNIGILMFDRDLKVDSQYSGQVKKIFTAMEPTGESILDFLFKNSSLTQEERDINKTTLLNILGEDEINWELNRNNLTQDYSTSVYGDKRELRLSWTAVLNDDVVEKVIVTVDDVTEEKKTQKDLERHRKIEAHLREIISAVREVGLNSTLGFLTKLELFVMASQQEPDKASLLSDLHGIKGEARSLGFSKLSARVHELESEIIADKNLNFAQSEVFQSFNLLCEEFLEAKRSIFENRESSGEWVLSEPLSMIKKSITRNQGIQWDRFLIDDQVKEWPVHLKNDLTTLLHHAVQNTVDHGYVLPKLNRNIEIEICAFISESRLYLRVKDFGAGLDTKKLKQKFDQLDQATQKVVGRIENVVFLDQVSTAQNVSETSGRGVGMAAIAAIVAKYSGEINIFNNEDYPGAELQIVLSFADITDDQAA